MPDRTANRDEILAYIAELLDTDGFPDHCVNGLHVEGTTTVSRIAAGVSASRAFIDEGIAAGADLLLTHHGLIWGGTDSITGQLAGRVAPLMQANANLAAYHLPLDAHPDLGNNALLARDLGMTIAQEPFAHHEGRPIGILGRYQAAIPLGQLIEQVAGITGYDAVPRPPAVLPGGPDEVRTVAICSGGGWKFAPEAAALGADVFITGELSEPAADNAMELGITTLGAGHYATEICGIRALAMHVADRFGLPWAFHYVPNPI